MFNTRRVAVLAGVAGSLAAPGAAQAANSYSDAVLSDAPLMYLQLDESAGATVAEDATDHYHGTYVGSPTLGAQAPFIYAGKAVELHAADAITSNVPAASGSVELWVAPNKLARNQQAGLVAHGDPNGDGWALGIGAKRKLAWTTRGATASSKVTLTAGSWTQLTVTWSGDKVRIYRNGVLAKQLSTNAGMPASTGGAVQIGGTGAGAFGAFAGRVDEVALYDRALTTEDVKEHFGAAKVPFNTMPPRIPVDAAQGNTLAVEPGTWQNVTATDPAATYQWLRCDADGDDCDEIDGATGTSYQVAAADACGTLQVVETRTNAAGSTSEPSNLTHTVPGECAPPTDPGTTDPGTTDPGTGAGPTTDPGTGTVTAPATAPDAGAVKGVERVSVPAPCLKLVSGRERVKVRRLGRLRVARTTGCLSGPVRASFKARKGVRVKKVRYMLDGRRLKTVKRPRFGARLRMSAGSHKLVVRVKPRTGAAKRVTVRLRVAAA